MKKFFITWHYTTHGIAFLKHILANFHQRLPKGDFGIWADLSQKASESYFDSPNTNGFIFDEVVYITAEQKVFDKISNRKNYRIEMANDEPTVESNLQDLWKALLEKEDFKNPKYVPSLQRDLEFVRTNYPEKEEDFLSILWRDVQHYTIDDQIKWFKEYSNAKQLYGARLVERKADLKDLRNEQEIAQSVKVILERYMQKYPNAQYYININLGTNETQVVWHALAQANCLPQNTVFLKSYDSKDDSSNKRFKNFTICPVPINIFEQIQPPSIFKGTQSEVRKIADLKMSAFIKAGFTILLLGERGVGKSELAKKFIHGKNFIEANCASFDDDSKAESELFGYEKGAFTGAEKNGKSGLFQEANGGVLFLDEIHHLSKRVQGKLMKALQTDRDNFFQVRRLGSTKSDPIRCTVIFASNRSIEELRKGFLYEDFFDRISQNVINIPSLRETPEDRFEDWKNIWQQMRFGKKDDAPQDKKLLDWLNNQPLYGNYRDLQKIAIYWNAYTKFSQELQDLLLKNKIENAFDYTKNEFLRLQSAQSTEPAYFDKEKSIREMQDDFNRDLANWVNQQFGSMAKASTYFKEKFGETIEPRTLYKYKNGK